MSVPNFANRYDELGEIQSDDRFLRLCAMQIRELSEVTARQAMERVKLGLAIQREWQDRAEAWEAEEAE